MKSIVNILANVLPYSFQRWIEDTCIEILSKSIKKHVIIFRGYNVELPSKDLSATTLYFRYLLTGEWRHELYTQALVEQICNTFRSICFIDCGSSYGLFTLLAASFPSVESIVAIEASTVVSKHLKDTIKANNLERKVRVINAAVSDRVGETFEYINNEHSERSRVTNASSSNVSNAILSTTIDDEIPFSRISQDTVILIKIDIEGCEPEAFVGMNKLFSSSLDFIIIFEFHVPLLDTKPDGARVFAEKILSYNHKKLFNMDPTNKRLIPIDSLLDFSALIETGRKATFPGNVFNLMMTNITCKLWN